MAVGVDPEQMVCAPVAVLPATAVLIVIATAAAVSAGQTPEVTTRLYQVEAVSAAGEYPCALLVPLAGAKPAVADVMLLSQA